MREALIYAFDFEWTNKTIMYAAYERTHSLFQNSDMMVPTGEETEPAGAGAAGAVPRPGAGRGLRRALSCRRCRTASDTDPRAAA